MIFYRCLLKREVCRTNGAMARSKPPKGLKESSPQSGRQRCCFIADSDDLMDFDNLFSPQTVVFGKIHD